MKRARNNESGDERSSRKKVAQETLEADAAVALPWEIIEEEIPKWLPALPDLLSLTQTCKRLASRYLVKEIRYPIVWDNLVKFPALRTIEQGPQPSPDSKFVALDKIPSTWTHTLKSMELVTVFHIQWPLAATAFAGLETLKISEAVTIDSDALARLTNLKTLEIYSDIEGASGIRALTQLTSLSCIQLSATEACLPPLVNLQFLSMNAVQLTMSSLHCQQSLRTLHLIRCDIRNHLDLSEYHSLTDLNVKSCKKAWNINYQLALPPSLKKLCLTWTYFTNRLEALYKTPQLQHFYYYYTGDQPRDHRGDFYSVLRSLEHLEYLSITAECGIIQADALDHATRLESLHLSNPKLPPDFHFSQLTHLKELSLVCDETNLCSQNLYALSQLEKLLLCVPLCNWDASSINIEELSLALPRLESISIPTGTKNRTTTRL